MTEPFALRQPATTYRGDALRAVALPLGGIGTGTIALCGDGSLRQWQIHNQVNHLACLPHSFFAVWARASGAPPVSRLLQSAALHSTECPQPLPTANDHVVPQCHRELLARLPGMAETEFVGEYPVAEVTFRDPALPVLVALEAFSPFVPLDAEASGIPAILFHLTAHNPGAARIEVSVAATLQNAVGWDGVAPIAENRCDLYGGNVNALIQTGDMTAIVMTGQPPPGAASYGSMALAALDPGATFRTHWDDLDALWSDLRDGRLENGSEAGPSPAGRTWNGALAVPFTLEPGQARRITFLLAWYFPNREVNYRQSHLFGVDDSTPQPLGNHYGRRYSSVTDVLAHVQSDLTRLCETTRQARQTLHDTSLPRALIDAVSSQVSVLRSPTCFRAGDGNLYGFEGGCGASTSHCETGGCCPMNCTHVWNYEMAVARLFPGLERTMRTTEWEVQQHPIGFLPHRVLLPLDLPRPWDRDTLGPAHPALDGLLGGILKTYREYRACGDRDWLARQWPPLTRALRHLWTVHDPGRSGVIEGEQPNTYDISIYGANTFIGSLYLAALRAMQEMGHLLGEARLAEECAAVYARGRLELERRLWNGEYYIQAVDLERFPEHNWGRGCLADQLVGQWWAHLLGLGHLLEPDHIRTALQSLVRYNYRTSFAGVTQAPRVFAAEQDAGLLVCTWPHGGRPKVPIRYADEVWTGIEYEVAALALFEGLPEVALPLLAAVQNRYDGRRLNPWNNIECGDHYVRAMSAWSLLEAASGFQYDAGTGSLAFAPVIAPEDYRAPFVTRDGWGAFSQQITGERQRETLSLAYGALALRRLTFRVQAGASHARVRANGTPVPARFRREGQVIEIVFEPPLTLRESTLEIESE